MATSDHSDGAKRASFTREDLRELLKPTATTKERVRGLLGLGLHASEIAASIGVSVSGLRNWSNEHAEPRADAAITLDDLRAVAKILLDGGLEPKRAAHWFRGLDPERFGDDRPLDLLRTDPVAVRSAAHNEVLQNEISAAQNGAGPPKLVPSGH